MKTFIKEKILPVVKARGGTIFQVGGSVRDELLGLTSKDLDIMVVGIEMSELKSLLENFGRTDMVGASFGIIKFKPHGLQCDEPIDISVPRVDLASTGDKHTDFEVKLEGVSLLEDQMRRDFTVNFLAKNFETDEMCDVDGLGIQDIEDKLIRMVAPRAFTDDPLRMLRALQFSSRLNFNIEDNTFAAIKENAHLINTVSPDRFMEEFSKLFFKSKNPSNGITLLFNSGIANQLIPGLRTPTESTKIMMDTLPKTDAGFTAFITLFLAVLEPQVATEIVKTKLKGCNTNDMAKVVSETLTIRNAKRPDNFTLALWNMKFHNQTFENSRLAWGVGLQSRIDALSELEVPTSLKTMSVKGEDLMANGLKGKAIGDMLMKMLKFAVENKTNDKDRLLELL